MLTLSQAIRIGSRLRPQCFGATGKQVRGGVKELFRKVDATCAWGAAHEASGNKPTKLLITEDAIPFRGIAPIKAGEIVMAYVAPYEWTPVCRSWTTCPKCDKEDYVERLIAHLNDDHRWKRERIADWVEAVEVKVAANAAVDAILEARKK